MAGSLPKYQEGAPSLGPVSKDTKKVGAGSVGVCDVLLRSGADGVTLWGGNLGVVGVNGQNTEGGPHEIPQSGGGQDDKAAVVRDLEEDGRGEFSQRSRDSENGYVHR